MKTQILNSNLDKNSQDLYLVVLINNSTIAQWLLLEFI